MGFEFLSITRINRYLAIEGLAWDPNHHIKSYRSMARITLAEWTCSINNCENPIDSPSERKYSRLNRKLPTAYIEAQSGLKTLELNL